jgi:hypothetical protein
MAFVRANQPVDERAPIPPLTSAGQAPAPGREPWSRELAHPGLPGHIPTHPQGRGLPMNVFGVILHTVEC